ncbi:MAG TPA: hypothetical protein PK156_36995, partial [Polyangium sp.]|nr:hypothetical protein [Polyangium sp.]
PHPVVSGRLGLALMKLGQLDRAAEELHLAMEQGQGVTAQERREVATAYDKAKVLTTWVTVIISHTGAKITCDGIPWNRAGQSSFWRFTMPGEHTLRAQLDGYAEAVETFKAKPGDNITISLNLVPLAVQKLPEVPQPAIEKRAADRNFPPMMRTSNIATDPNYAPNEDPSYGEPKDTTPAKKKSGPRFSVHGGVVSVFGVASWNPAVGGVLGVAVKPKEFLSLGLEGRAAWLTTGVGGGQISAMTFGGNLSACGHVRWFFGCALGHIGTIDVTFSEQSYKKKDFLFVKPGVGGRIGANIPIASSFQVSPSIDIVGLKNGTKLVAGNNVVADLPAVLISGQVFGGWEF